MNEDELTLREMKDTESDLRWMSKNFDYLKKKYPKKFVAIKNQQVVLSASKLEKLIKTLREKYGEPNDYIIDFIPDDRYTLVV